MSNEFVKIRIFNKVIIILKCFAHFRVHMLEETIRDIDSRNQERLTEEQKKYRDVKVGNRFFFNF